MKSTKDLIIETLEDDSVFNLLWNLWQRWQDEKHFEDWSDYDKAIKSRIPDVVRTTRRPVGFVKKFNGVLIKISLIKKGSRLNLRARYI